MYVFTISFPRLLHEKLKNSIKVTDTSTSSKMDRESDELVLQGKSSGSSYQWRKRRKKQSCEEEEGGGGGGAG